MKPSKSMRNGRRMPFYFKSFYLPIVLVLSLSPCLVKAGVFGGAEFDDNGKPTWHLGAQTEGQLHYGIFTGQQQYILDKSSYSHRYMAGGIGYRWYAEWITSLLVGLENSRLRQTESALPRQHFFGLYAQLALMKFTGDKNLEYLLSYSQDSEQLWTRFRFKLRTSEQLLLGPELYASRFMDSEALGAGLLLEKIFAPYTITVKLGLEAQNKASAAYGGIEFYRGF